MKKVLSIVLFQLIFCLSYAQSNKIIDGDKVTTVDEKCFYKYDMSLVTGTVMGHYKNGQLKIKATYKDGIPDGLYKEWWENGRLKLEMTYKNGERNGLFRSWNYRGGLMGKRTYVKGDIDGITNGWFYDGRLSSTGNYINGKKEGVHKMWSYEDHSILWSLETYKNGQLDGESKFWDDKTGELIRIRIYKGGKLVKETKYK
jgi:antitoxin component YwqK of YwqJK toxin-antitoxin module